MAKYSDYTKKQPFTWAQLGETSNFANAEPSESPDGIYGGVGAVQLGAGGPNTERGTHSSAGAGVEGVEEGM